MTRDGSVPGPTEPGRRCFVLPCVFGPPPALWRFTMPWKPCPLEVPVTFTVSPTANTSTFTRSPMLYDGTCAFAFPGSSRRTERSTRGGASSPAFLAWPTAASVARCPFGEPSPRFEARRRRDVPRPSCTELYPTFAESVTATTGFGGASITVTGICCPASLKIWVIPSFLPTMPIISLSFLVSHCGPYGLTQLDCRTGCCSRQRSASVVVPVDCRCRLPTRVPVQSTNPVLCATQ